jgi:hypothetical protein
VNYDLFLLLFFTLLNLVLFIVLLIIATASIVVEKFLKTNSKYDHQKFNVIRKYKNT